MNTLVKQKTLRDAKHLKFIRSLCCAKCKRVPVEACHIRKFGGGGTSMKPGDDKVIPMCSDCHLRQHSVGEITFHGGEEGVRRAIKLAHNLYEVSGDWETSVELILDFIAGR